MNTITSDERDAAYVATLAAEAIHAGCLEKFMFMYTYLVRKFPLGHLRHIADEALARALPKKRGKAV